MGSPKSNLQIWIDLTKWFITSVVLVVMTTLIDAGFKDRAAGLAELKFYDKYVTDIVLKNSTPVERRLLAQYFSCVTPSVKLQKCWKIYYDSIYPEYIKYITPVMEEESALTERYKTLMRSPDHSDTDSTEIRDIEKRLKEIRSILYPEIKLPDTEIAVEVESR